MYRYIEGHCLHAQPSGQGNHATIDDHLFNDPVQRFCAGAVPDRIGAGSGGWHTLVLASSRTSTAFGAVTAERATAMAGFRRCHRMGG